MGLERWELTLSMTGRHRNNPDKGYRSAAYSALLHLLTLCPHARIQFFHHADERAVFVPEGRIVALFLNQQRGNGGLRGGRKRRGKPFRARPEFLVTGYFCFLCAQRRRVKRLDWFHRWKLFLL